MTFSVARTMLAGCLLFAGFTAQADGEAITDIRALYSDLSDLNGIAARCEEHLKNFAKRALEESPSCKQFSQKFSDRFKDRASLLAEVSRFTSRFERGELACDRQCQDLLQRCEELRIGIIYVLDYMEFVREF
jgi:hypothetical protein